MFGLVMEFRVIKALVVVPNRVAIPLSESPLTTVYLLAELGLGVGLGVGLDAALIRSTCPIRILFAFVMPLRLIRFRVVVPNFAAMPLSVSPAKTVYLLLGAGAAGEVLGVGLGDEADGLGVGLGDEADGLGVGLGDEADGLGVGDEAEWLGVGDEAEGLGVGDEAEGLGVGLGVGVTAVSNPLTSVYFPNRDAIVYGWLDADLRSAKALT
jgi:hypothetical protein